MAKWTGDRPYDYWHWSREAQGKYNSGYIGYYRDGARPTGALYPTYSPEWWLERGKTDARDGRRTVHGLWLRYDKGGVWYYVGDGAGARTGTPPPLSAQQQADRSMRPAPTPSTSDSAYLWGYLYAFISTQEPTGQTYAPDSYEFWREQGLLDAFAFRPKRTARDISWNAEDGRLWYVGHGDEPTTDLSVYRARLASASGQVDTSTSSATVTDPSSATSTATTTSATGTTATSGSNLTFSLGLPLQGLINQIFGGGQQGYYYPQYGSFGGFYGQAQPAAYYGSPYGSFGQAGYAPSAFQGYSGVQGFPPYGQGLPQYGQGMNQYAQGPVLQVQYQRPV
ncbi:MAG: hypothetical protein U1A78_33820 [Polyangia bacterium]